MAGAVHESGESSFKDGWGGWRTSALGAEERPASFRGVSSMPWAPGLGAFRGLGPGRLTWLSGREGRNLLPRWSVGLELLSENGNQWGVKGAGLGCFVGDCGALGCVDGFQVKALVPDLL